MDAVAFSRALDTPQALAAAGVEDLSAIATVNRPDGLPQDWVDGLASLSPEQAVTLKSELDQVPLPWASALAAML